MANNGAVGGVIGFVVGLMLGQGFLLLLIFAVIGFLIGRNVGQRRKSKIGGRFGFR